MDMDYLHGRLNRANAADADIVEIDIEEFESLLNAVDKYSQKWTEAYNQGKEEANAKIMDYICQLQDIVLAINFMVKKER